MKVGILGSGEVARTLAMGFLRHRYEVMLGSRDPARLASWTAQHPQARSGSLADTAAFGEMLVLAVKGRAAAEALRIAGTGNLGGKIVIDATNPIADAPPQHGVLRFFTTLDDSLLERLQREFPAVRLVKAFNSVGSALMVNPAFREGRPTMFICGNDEAAKRSVTGVLDRFGWEAADMGMAEAARAIEPLCMLWCIPGFLRHEQGHAFKLLRRSDGG
ncbi:MAG TPA: NAD(P)-binding domain-containing protein [Solimonas sp.]|nr:NAD(P)-binding domain-containing protein [Solimonas sp.]